MELKTEPSDFVVEEIPAVSLVPDGSYGVYRLDKEGVTTPAAVRVVARAAGRSVDDVGYAGLKDKHARTSQYISVPSTGDVDVADQDVSVEYMGRASDPISIGQLRGNRFTIRVRDCERCVKRRVVVNYFGEQRFSSNNAVVGKHLVLEEYRAAFEAVRDAGGRNARVVNRHLQGGDYRGALDALPDHLLSLYVHAFQSELWNRVARRLWGFTGSIPLLGYGTRFKREVVERAYRSVADVRRSDFVVESWPELSQAGTWRERLVRPRRLSVVQDGEEWVVSFALPKGSYATVVVKQLVPG